ncbi:retrovirus-related pol polyprotein from transposon TNT 1-94 [Tanacetum coccineum]
MITTLNEEIANLNNMLSKEKSTVSSLQEEKKRLKSDFKIREDEFLDKQILLENKIKELDNILVKTGQLIQTMHMLSPKPDSFYHTDQKMALGYQNPFYLKQAQQKQQKAAKFIRDFKSLTNKADESLAKHKALEFEFERLLRAVVSQNIMSIVQSNFVVDTSNLQTELERTKERFENSHNDIQQKIEWLQAQLGDLKGKSKDSTCASDTLDPLSQKLENENVELEFQVLNYLREIEHLKTTYKNLFDSISMTRAQTKSIIDPLQDKLHDMIYENAKLRAQLFDKASEQKDTTKGTSANTKFANQSILGRPFLQPLKNNFVVRQPNAFQSERLKFSNNRVPQKVDKSNDLSKPVTSNSVPTTKESKVVKNDNVIAPGMFRINPHNTAKTIRPQPRSNTKNDRVPSTSKNRCIKNKEVEVEEHHRNLLLFKNKKHMSSESNNIKLAIRNDKSEVVCAMCKQYLITTNHDVCVLNYVNGMNSHKKNQKANVSNTKNKKKQKPQVWKPKKVRSKERLASPKPRKPRTYLRWSPTGRIFDLKGKIIESSDAECHSDYSNGHLNMFMVRRLGMLKAHDRKSEASHKFRLKVIGNHLEVAFRRNTCFVRNLEGVDLLKGNRTTNLYTINIHEMASTSPIFLMARATSTKSWLWHQHLSHLNFDTINDLAKNDLVIGLPKYKYHKEHLCPSYEALCYPKNDREDIGKLGAKGLDLTYAPSTITIQQPTERELDLLFEAMYDDYIGGHSSAATRTALAAQAHQVLQTPMTSTTIADTVQTPTNSSSQATNILTTSQDVDELETQQQHV